MKNILDNLQNQKIVIFWKATIIILVFGLFSFLSIFLFSSIQIQVAADSTASLPETSPQTYFKEGLALFRQGEYEQAIPYFETMLTRDPEHTESYYYLGQCYLQLGIIEYNNKNIFKAYNLYRKANEIAEQVIPLYIKGINENPDNLDIYIKLGYIYEIRSQAPFNDEYKIALEYYLKGLEVAKRLEDNLVSNSSISTSTTHRYNPYRGIKIYLLSRAGYIYWLKKDYAEAINYLEPAVELSPENIEANYYLGLSYVKIGEKEEAKPYLSRVIELVPESEYAREAEKILKKID
ncbi:MAG: hypothetical protein Kow00103_14400 [Candidatus Caldatribacteriota bacterium]